MNGKCRKAMLQTLVAPSLRSQLDPLQVRRSSSDTTNEKMILRAYNNQQCLICAQADEIITFCSAIDIHMINEIDL